MIFGLFKFKRNKKTKSNTMHKRSAKSRKTKSAVKKSTKKITKVKTKTEKLIPKKKKIKVEVVGKVIHYFPKVKAAVIKIKKNSVTIGDSVQIKGHTTDFKQKVVSMQINHKPIAKATKGNEIGLRVKKRVRINDLVYKL